MTPDPEIPEVRYAIYISPAIGNLLPMRVRGPVRRFRDDLWITVSAPPRIVEIVRFDP